MKTKYFHKLFHKSLAYFPHFGGKKFIFQKTGSVTLNFTCVSNTMTKIGKNCQTQFYTTLPAVNLSFCCLAHIILQLIRYSRTIGCRTPKLPKL